MYRTALAYLKTWKNKPAASPWYSGGPGRSGNRTWSECSRRRFSTTSSRSTWRRIRRRRRYSRRRTPKPLCLCLRRVTGSPSEPGPLCFSWTRFRSLPNYSPVFATSTRGCPRASCDRGGVAARLCPGRTRVLRARREDRIPQPGSDKLSEFLLGLNRASLQQFLCQYAVGQEVPQAIHGELLRLLRQFLVVGGMPASVAAFIGPGNHRDSEAERQAILSTFREDFARYGKRLDHRRLDKVLAKIPRLAARSSATARSTGRSARGSLAVPSICFVWPGSPIGSVTRRPTACPWAQRPMTAISRFCSWMWDCCAVVVA